MTGIKRAYSELAKQFVQSTEEEIKDYLERARERKFKFWANWEEVDIDEFVDRFAPHGDAPHMEDKKIVVNDEESHTQIVADPIGYVRVLDTSRGLRKKDYLDINGVPIKTYEQRKGETDQQFLDRKMIASHFRIKKQKDGNNG